MGLCEDTLGLRPTERHPSLRRPGRGQESLQRDTDSTDTCSPQGRSSLAHMVKLSTALPSRELENIAAFPAKGARLGGARRRADHLSIWPQLSSTAGITTRQARRLRPLAEKLITKAKR